MPVRPPAAAGVAREPEDGLDLHALAEGRELLGRRRLPTRMRRVRSSRSVKSSGTAKAACSS